jgi:hypothetical protein
LTSFSISFHSGNNGAASYARTGAALLTAESSEHGQLEPEQHRCQAPAGEGMAAARSTPRRAGILMEKRKPAPYQAGGDTSSHPIRIVRRIGPATPCPGALKRSR